MKVIIGLGNPGKEYEYTKHNVGFLTIDVLAERLGIKVTRIKHKALTGEGFVGTEKVLLVKPQTYMNLSGNSVREVVSFYKIDLEDMIVVYDDIDIPIGTIRARAKGSAGTHNGMRSIIYDLGDDGFPRIRIGIGGERKGDLAGYVISGFKGDDKTLIEDAINKAADAIESYIRNGIDAAMNEYNTKKKTEKADKKAAEKSFNSDAKADEEGTEDTGGHKAAKNEQEAH